MEIINGKIDSAFLGIEDHGCLTIMLHFSFYGSGVSSQGYGGYSYNGDKGAVKGMKDIRGILEVIGKDDWNDVRNKIVRVKRDGGKIVAIGNILEDKWFSFN